MVIKIQFESDRELIAVLALIAKRLKAVECTLQTIKHQEHVNFMATKQSFEDLRVAMDAETTRIAGKIDDLVEKLAAGGMTDTEEAETLAAFTALADRLKVVGSDPVEPIPPVEG